MTAMLQMSDEEQHIVSTVRAWVDAEVVPAASRLESKNEYPSRLVDQMKEMGVFGLTIPTEYGGTGASAACYALVTEEISRGWMSLAGVFGGHLVVAKLVQSFGREDQKAHLLPRMATGELRAAMALTEPSGGSDLQSMRTTATADGSDYVVTGSKTWITNAERADIIALMCKTDATADPAHTGISILIVRKGPGLTVSQPLGKLGYRGIESCEITFDQMRTPMSSLLGGSEGQGFQQMMSALEAGRIQVAARAVGVARAAYEASLKYAQQREAFGRPIWRHQSIANYLADMATKIGAARLLTLNAAVLMDQRQRCDLEAGMAKLFASEIGVQVTLDAMRIHGAYGYSTEFDIERFYRDAPLMVIGEGTNEIQRNVIVKQLIKRDQNA